LSFSTDLDLFSKAKSMTYLTKPFTLSFKSKEFALQIDIPRTDIWLNEGK